MTFGGSNANMFLAFCFMNRCFALTDSLSVLDIATDIHKMNGNNEMQILPPKETKKNTNSQRPALHSAQTQYAFHELDIKLIILQIMVLKIFKCTHAHEQREIQPPSFLLLDCYTSHVALYLSVVQLTVNIDLPLCDIPRQIRDGMGDIWM